MKIASIIAFLMYIGVFVVIVLLSACTSTPIVYNKLVKQNTSCNQDSIEGLVELTEKNSHLNWINNSCLTCEN